MAIVPNLVIWAVKQSDVRVVARLLNTRPSTVLGYLEGRITPRLPTLGRLNNVYRQINYTILRSSGANIQTANRFKGQSPDKVNKVANDWENYAKKISKLKSVDEAIITQSLGMSDLTQEDLEFERY